MPKYHDHIPSLAHSVFPSQCFGIYISSAQIQTPMMSKLQSLKNSKTTYLVQQENPTVLMVLLKQRPNLQYISVFS